MNECVPKLLRAIARGTAAIENKHDVIFNVAADEIERLRAVLYDIVGLDHHNHGPESRATTLARAALNGLGDEAKARD